MDGLQGIAEFFRELRNFQAGIGRVAAAVVKKITDVVRLEYFYEALILDAVFFQPFEFEAAGTKCA